jgi:VanZ family protein
MNIKYATIVVSTLIIIAVLIPGPNLPGIDIVGFDKVVHIGLFGLWAIAFRYDFNTPSFKFTVAFLIGAAFSVTTEVLQLLVEGRSFDVYDLVADAIGLIAGLGVSGIALKLLKKSK